jgi:hypothetical protein
MTARVHTPRNARGEGKRIFFLNRQCVDVASQGNYRAGSGSTHASHYASLEGLLIGYAPSVKKVNNVLGRLVFLEA